MSDSNDKPKSATKPARRFSASCLEDARFREYYAHARGDSIESSLPRIPSFRYYKGLQNYFRPPPSSPTLEPRSSSPVPLLELSRGPYGSNWRTVAGLTSRPVPDPPRYPQPKLPQSAPPRPPPNGTTTNGTNGTTTSQPPRLELNESHFRAKRHIDPCEVVQNAEALHRRRNRTLCERHVRFEWILEDYSDDGEEQGISATGSRGRPVEQNFTTQIPHFIEGSPLPVFRKGKREYIDPNPFYDDEAETNGEAENGDMPREDGNSSGDVVPDDRHLHAEWDPFWPKVNDRLSPSDSYRVDHSS